MQTERIQKREKARNIKVCSLYPTSGTDGKRTHRLAQWLVAGTEQSFNEEDSNKERTH